MSNQILCCWCMTCFFLHERSESVILLADGKYCWLINGWNSIKFRLSHLIQCITWLLVGRADSASLSIPKKTYPVYNNCSSQWRRQTLNLLLLPVPSVLKRHRDCNYTLGYLTPSNRHQCQHILVKERKSLTLYNGLFYLVYIFEMFGSHLCFPTRSDPLNTQLYQRSCCDRKSLFSASLSVSCAIDLENSLI